MDTTTTTTPHFDRQYQTHLKHLKLKGLQPKTIDAYARAIRRDYADRRDKRPIRVIAHYQT